MRVLEELSQREELTRKDLGLEIEPVRNVPVTLGEEPSISGV
jgi:hypothetical protein